MMDEDDLELMIHLDQDKKEETVIINVADNTWINA